MVEQKKEETETNGEGITTVKSAWGEFNIVGTGVGSHPPLLIKRRCFCGAILNSYNSDERCWPCQDRLRKRKNLHDACY